MKRKRNTITYDLVRGQGNQVVYRGVTSQDPDERANQHRNEGKKFDRIVKTSVRMSKESAEKREEENLARYRRGHGGRNPLYNETDDG